MTLPMYRRSLRRSSVERKLRWPAIARRSVVSSYSKRDPASLREWQDRKLLFWFCRCDGSFCLLCVFGPGRCDSLEPSIGDRLSQVLGGMAHDEQENATLGVLPAKPVKTLVQVSFGNRHDGLLRMREGVLQCRDDLRFIRRGFLQTFQVDIRRRRCSHHFVEVIVRRRDVQEDFGKRAHVVSGPPRVFIRGNCLRQANEL